MISSQDLGMRIRRADVPSKGIQKNIRTDIQFIITKISETIFVKQQ